MNLLLVDPGELRDGEWVELRDRRARHLREVLGVREGQWVRVGITRTAEGQGEVIKIEPERVLLRLGPMTARPRPSLELVLGWARPKAVSRAVQNAAASGLRRLDLVRTWNVDRSYQHSHKLELSSVENDARLGCEQGRQIYLPEIGVHGLFLPFLEHQLSQRLAEEPTRTVVVAHPMAQRSVEQVLLSRPPGPITVAVGPDRGFVERELASFQQLGAQVVHFGDAVLTVEAAVAAILAQVKLLQRLSQSGAG